MQIPNSICNQSHDVLDHSERHQLGNLTQKAELEAVCTGLSYTSTHGILGDVRLWPRPLFTNSMHRTPTKPFDVLPYNFRGKAPIILERGSSVCVRATWGKRGR